MTLYPTSTS